MVSFGEKAKIKKAGNLNKGRSYVITTVFCIPERESPQPLLPYCTMSQKCHYMGHSLHTFKNSFTCDYFLFSCFLILA